MRLINPAGPWGARRRLREALGPDEQLSVQSGVLIDDAWTSAHSVTEDTLYGSSDNSDSPAYTRAAAGGAVTSYIGACVDTAGTATWEIRDGHGDIVGAIDTNATYTASPPVDEFGVGAPPARRLGYLGGAERFTTDTTLGIIRMGVRLYDPTLGRFLQTDPNRGGSANNYDYANQNPINDLDLGGNRSFFCSEDFCDAEHARMQIGNPDSPLNRSETFTVNSCCGYERPLRWERMYSMVHQDIRSFSDEAEIFGGVAAGLDIGFAAVGTAPEDLTVLGQVSLYSSLVGSGATCSKGITARCGFAVLATAGTFGANEFVDAAYAVKPLRVAGAAIGAGWSALQDFAGF